jgi:hypothetical protein
VYPCGLLNVGAISGQSLVMFQYYVVLAFQGFHDMPCRGILHIGTPDKG